MFGKCYDKTCLNGDWQQCFLRAEFCGRSLAHYDLMSPTPAQEAWQEDCEFLHCLEQYRDYLEERTQQH